MSDPDNPLAAWSDRAAKIVEQAASNIVAVHSGSRSSSSGIHWRPGVIVTAEERVERDDGIEAALPGGRRVPVSLAGRDPTTDVAILRFQPDGLPTATVTEGSPRPGHMVLAVGSHDGAPLAALGIVAFAGGAWQSVRGGTIDSFVRLDLSLSQSAEGGALIDARGGIIGMAVLGPRRRALAIPTATINRAVDQLLAKGQVFRGYLGAGLQSIKHEKRASRDKQEAPATRSPSPSNGGGVLVVSLDPDGPSARAGMLVGDIVTAWNGQPIDRVREVMRLLGPESVGSTIDLGLLRGGAPATLKIVVGERAVR